MRVAADADLVVQVWLRARVAVVPPGTVHLHVKSRKQSDRDRRLQPGASATIDHIAQLTDLEDASQCAFLLRVSRSTLDRLLNAASPQFRLACFLR